MTNPTTTISVRGEARRTVTPDQAELHTTVSRTAGSGAAASAATREAIDELAARLGELGGEVLAAANTRTALTWSVQAIQTHDEYSTRGGPAGRLTCTANVAITLRDLDRLRDVVAAVTDRDGVRLQWVNWSVDDDNPEWPLVRADAIRAALRQGDDYATALGGSVLTVDHVADVGLLGGDRPSGWEAAGGTRAVAAAGVAEGVSLDPVPQVLSAVIDARFTAAIGPLPGR